MQRKASMHDNAENISSALSNAASSKATGILPTITAGGVVATTKDPAILGDYLATHGLLLLSWVEIFQVVGSIYVTYKLAEIAIAGVKKLIKQISRFITFCRGFKRQPIKIKRRGS
jgi:hypothetical protein